MTWEINQRIDFYVDDFKAPRLPKDVYYFALSVLVCFVGFWLFFLTEHWIHARTLKKEQVYEQTLGQLASDYQILKEQADKAERSPVLVKKKQKLVELVEHNQRILAYLRHNSFSGMTSISRPIAELGNARVEGVWLSKFFLSEEQFRLNGVVTKPSLITLYLQSLSKQPSLKGKTFEFVDISRDKKRGWLNFTLDSKPQVQLDNQPGVYSVEHFGGGQP